MTREDFEELKTVLVNAAQAAVQTELRGLRADIKQWLEENRTLHARMTVVEHRLSLVEGKLGFADTEPPGPFSAE